MGISSFLPPDQVILVMGVSGSGKSTLARALALEVHGQYLDADDFHPPENIAKMASGQPLTDQDRAGWLANLNAALIVASRDRLRPVVACSALKQVYRERLKQGLPGFVVVFIDGPRELLEERIRQRTDHFMPASLLDSQLATLEAPRGPGTIQIDLRWSTDRAVEEVLKQLEVRSGH